MSETPCPRCRRATPDGLLCTTCTRRCTTAIDDLTRYLPEVLTAVARLDNVTRADIHPAPSTASVILDQPGPPPAAPQPRATFALVSTTMPVNLDAAELLATTRMLIAGLVGMLSGRPVRANDPVSPRSAGDGYAEGPICPPHVHDLRPGGCAHHGADGRREPCRRLHCRHASCKAIRDRWQPVTPPALAWLRGPGLKLLRRHEQGPWIVDQLYRAAAAVERAIDGRAPELFLGLCDVPDLHDGTRTCGAQLYARADDEIITCHACGWDYPVAERRDQMLTEVRDLLERPKVIADALTSLDLPITARTLDDWISRDKKLHQLGRPRRDGLPLILADPVYDDAGKPLYRVGDVIDRIEALRARGDKAG